MTLDVEENVDVAMGRYTLEFEKCVSESCSIISNRVLVVRTQFFCRFKIHGG